MIHVANTELMGAVGNLLSRCTAIALNPKQEYPPLQGRLPSSEEWGTLISAIENLPGWFFQHAIFLQIFDYGNFHNLFL